MHQFPDLGPNVAPTSALPPAALPAAAGTAANAGRHDAVVSIRDGDRGPPS